MDPAPLFLLEMGPNDRGNHAQSGAPASLQNPHQHLSAERSSSNKKPDVHKPRLMSMTEVKSYQVVRHFPALVNPIYAQAQASSNSLNFLPAAYPPPLHHQALSPCDVPQFLCPPFSPPPSYWLPSASPHRPSSSFGLSPSMLHPFNSPPEFWPPPPILCPQMVPIHQTCAGQASGSTHIHITTASERRQKHMRSGHQRSMSHVKEEQQNKLQERSTDSEIKINDSPGPSPFWYEELKKEDSFEECMALLDSFFVQLLPAQTKKTGALDLKTSSLLGYVGELCSDPDFASKVESILDIETLMSPLSSDKDPLEVFTQEKQEQEVVSCRFIVLGPPGIQSADSPKQKGQNLSKVQDCVCCSPLLPSHHVSEGTGSPMKRLWSQSEDNARMENEQPRLKKHKMES